MRCCSMNQKITRVFNQLEGTKPTRTLKGEDSWSNLDANREMDRFEQLCDEAGARDGSYEVSNTHHPMAPPYKMRAKISGSLEQGESLRETGLYMGLPVSTEGEPTFLTTSKTIFNNDEVTKLEVVEGPEGTTARRLFTDLDQPELNYVEEYILA